jgi:hypothetical protein
MPREVVEQDQPLNTASDNEDVGGKHQASPSRGCVVTCLAAPTPPRETPETVHSIWHTPVARFKCEYTYCENACLSMLTR